ncbi:hypothetical protein CYMTET_30040 [Cymbomonas tetramitiformis]|uniref:Uncharacterized protein n=1 Tax=Cymbomonas tetramitiformis TaxID=36881 RepID=A0AAE0FJS2_9CHLO|nr:hypothetical protein CYMTET_30040 [Cymbomonas tetramitiformis]
MKVLQLVSPLGLRAQLKTRGVTQRPSARVRCLRCVQAISQDDPPRVDAKTFEKELIPVSEESKITVDAQTFESELLPVSIAEDTLGCPWEDDWDKYCEMVTEQVKVEETDDFLNVDESLLSMDDDETFMEDSLDLPEKKPEKKKKKDKAPKEFCRPSERGRWKTIQTLLRPTQTALGWDWSFYKLQNFRTEEEAQVRPSPT